MAGEKKKENNEEEFDLELNEYLIKDQEVILQTHNKINTDFSGKITKQEKGHVEVTLETSMDMLADDMGLIHGGFIFCAADYAAMAAVNERNVVLVASDIQFLSPVKIGDHVNFIADVRHKEGRKRNINVIGKVLDIKVFEGVFKTVITERHVLKLKLLSEEEDEK
ncbi:MAG: PaaI family thioesterase [Sulfurimonas sp.]|nr:PaaI family thioesterase [Sulfurimonas sp.]